MAKKNVRPKSASADVASASEVLRHPPKSAIERMVKALELGRRGRRLRALGQLAPSRDRA